MKPFKYNSKEILIGILILPPVAIIINYFIFGNNYFDNFRQFIIPTLISTAIIFIVYILCSMVATIMLNRFPKYSQALKRIGIELLLFIVIMLAAITILFYGYDYIGIEGMPV